LSFLAVPAVPYERFVARRALRPVDRHVQLRLTNFDGTFAQGVVDDIRAKQSTLHHALAELPVAHARGPSSRDRRASRADRSRVEAVVSSAGGKDILRARLMPSMAGLSQVPDLDDQSGGG
jgi:hypothetical protein